MWIMLTSAHGELNRFHSDNAKIRRVASDQIRLTLHFAESPLARHFSAISVVVASSVKNVLDHPPRNNLPGRFPEVI